MLPSALSMTCRSSGRKATTRHLASSITRYLTLILLALPLAGCGVFDSIGDRPDEVLDPDVGGPLPRPGSWPVFHGENANHGALFVATDFALEPKWSVDVGPVLYSSPVVGGNGSVYVGDLNGRLHAISRFGSKRWMLDFTPAMGSPPAMINSSPAVSDNGAIYVVSTEVVAEETFRSTLHVVGSNGALIRSTPLPEEGYTTSSPKIWRFDGEDHIFLYVREGFDSAALLVFDALGQVVAREAMFCNTPVTGSSPIWDALGTFFELMHDAFFDGDLGIEFDTSGTSTPLSERFGWLDPTVAIVDEPGLIEEGRPLIVVVDKACFVKAFEWAEPRLVERWSDRHEFLFQSSPAVAEAGRVIVTGDREGHVRGRDLITGDELWEQDLDDGPIMSTAATFGGSIAYVLTEEHIAGLDTADGTLLLRQPTTGRSAASPVLTGSKLYVSSRADLASYSLDLRDHVHIHQGRGGLATPAVGADGTIYAVTEGTEETWHLRAYGGLDFTLPEAPDRPGEIAP